MTAKSGFTDAAEQRSAADRLVSRLLGTARALNEGLLHPSFLSVPKEFSHLPRNIQNPPFWAAPEAIANLPWNMSDEELLAKGPDRFTVEEKILGILVDFHEVTKTKDGYVGLPENGAYGPGIMGVGYTEDGKPIPVTSGADFLGFSIIDERIKILLGERKPLSGEDVIVKTLLGGFVGKGETPREAAVREFLEEGVSSSLIIEEDLEQAFINRKINPENIDAIATKHGLDATIFKEPAMPEFKFTILKTRHPEVVEELADFMEKNLTSVYEALARGAGRSCSRQIFVNIYSGPVDFNALEAIFTKHGLALDGSDEIGKPKLCDLADVESSGMFGSQGLFLLYGLANLILENEALMTRPTIVEQINGYIASAERHLGAVNAKIQQKTAPQAAAKPA